MQDDCWLWQGRVAPDGYAKSSKDVQQEQLAHRWMYRKLNGEIPEGLEIDHQCHDSNCSGGITCLHRRCVNPAHLKAVTKSVNCYRRSYKIPKTCPHGHDYLKYRSYRSTGGSYCGECSRIRALAYYYRRNNA